jgi:hypothetical protein
MEHILAEDFDAQSVFPVDLDGDGDVDIIGAARRDDRINWWENRRDHYFVEHVIVDGYNGPICVSSIDMDGDGDRDVLGSAIDGDMISWWENDGDQNFIEHTIVEEFEAIDLFPVDLDEDGDIDVLSAGYDTYSIDWWENDGNQSFSMNTITDSFIGAHSVYSVDMDNDDDMDIVGAAWAQGDIVWWRNNGNEDFERYYVDDDFWGVHCIHPVDLDEDGDMDVLGAGGSIKYWERVGQFSFIEQTILTGFEMFDVNAGDVDGDGDVDIIGAGNGKITWWENDGEEDFTERTVSCRFSGAVSASPTDIDSDGSLDIIGGARWADKVKWWHSFPATPDVGVSSIHIPFLLPEFTNYRCEASMMNVGDRIESFDVTMEIEPGGYSSSRQVRYLEPGDTRRIRFMPNFIFDTGSYTVTVTVDLEEDENPENDMRIKTIEAYPWWDVGPIAIATDSMVHPDYEKDISAIVENFGPYPASFDLVCEIEPGGYVSSTRIFGMPAGDTLRVTFPEPFIFDSGAYGISVYTQLHHDEYPENDTLVRETRVIARNDVGIQSIDMGPYLPMNSYVNPLVTVANWGLDTVRFRVMCEIDEISYLSTENVVDLPPFQPLQIEFQPDFYTGYGYFNMWVYTLLVRDEYTDNDTSYKYLEVEPAVSEDHPLKTHPLFIVMPTITRGNLKIQLQLPEPSTVELEIYDVLGRLRSKLPYGEMRVGSTTLELALDLPDGIYFARWIIGSRTPRTRKFLLVR